MTPQRRRPRKRVARARSSRVARRTRSPGRRRHPRGASRPCESACRDRPTTARPPRRRGRGRAAAPRRGRRAATTSVSATGRSVISAPLLERPPVDLPAPEPRDPLGAPVPLRQPMRPEPFAEEPVQLPLERGPFSAGSPRYDEEDEALCPLALPDAGRRGVGDAGVPLEGALDLLGEEEVRTGRLDEAAPSPDQLDPTVRESPGLVARVEAPVAQDRVREIGPSRGSRASGSRPRSRARRPRRVAGDGPRRRRSRRRRRRASRACRRKRPRSRASGRCRGPSSRSGRSSRSPGARRGRRRRARRPATGAHRS